MSQKDLSGRLARWALKLQGYNFIIEHRRGSENIVPDALSRAFESEVEGNDQISAIELERMPAIDLSSPHFDSNEYNQLKANAERTNFPDYKIVDKFLYKRTDFSRGSSDESNDWKLVVPPELRTDVLYAAHNTPVAAHGGIAKTVNLIRKFFFWPGLVNDVKVYVENCDLCKTSKAPTHITRPPMGQLDLTDRPFQKLYIDLLGPFVRSKKGNVGILIVLDHYSKFTFLKPLRSLVSKTIIEYLEHDIFNCFGVPETIVSDNGSQFKCKELEKFLQKFGITHVYTAVYSPQSNASERVNRSINAALRAFVKTEHRDWDAYLSAINASLRRTIHQSVGKPPYELVFGQTMITHGHDYALLKQLQSLNECFVGLERHDKLTLIRNQVQANIKAAYERNAKSYNLRARPRTFEIGQVVTRKNFVNSSLAKNFCAKLAPTGIRAIVKKKIGNHYYELQDVESQSIGTYHAKDIW